MPYKDPEKRKALNRERMRKARAEGTTGEDKKKAADRKFVWYWLDGGKEKRAASDRRRQSALKEEKIRRIDEHP